MINGFFKITDERVAAVAGYPIPDSWWSRGYEYAWAMKQIDGGNVADMGCGWHYRPLKDALAKRCFFVYAVDNNPGLLDLYKERPFPNNMGIVISDIDTVFLPELNTIFCISVLEDLGDKRGTTLKNFARQIDPNHGSIVLTCDVPFDDNLPCPKYPGYEIKELLHDMEDAGLEFADEVDLDKTGAIVNTDFNLTVFHCVLQVKHE